MKHTNIIKYVQLLMCLLCGRYQHDFHVNNGTRNNSQSMKKPATAGARNVVRDTHFTTERRRAIETGICQTNTDLSTRNHLIVRR